MRPDNKVRELASELIPAPAAARLHSGRALRDETTGTSKNATIFEFYVTHCRTCHVAQTALSSAFEVDNNGNFNCQNCYEVGGDSAPILREVLCEPGNNTDFMPNTKVTHQRILEDNRFSGGLIANGSLIERMFDS